MNRFSLAPNATPALALSLVLLACLTACGGGTGTSTDASAQSLGSTDSATTQSTDTAPLDGAVAAAMAQAEAQPAYHLAPALLDEPSRIDAGGTNASAHQAPHTFTVDSDAATLPTARLSRQALVQRLSDGARARAAAVSGDNASSAAPLATAIVGAVHTPAQIRAAYGLPALPAAGAAISASVAATLGAGQTIYLVDAYHDATALSDLNAFSDKFGLPSCANVTIATTARLPLAAPPASCTFSQVNSTSLGMMSATAPAYNATWAPESKLDVQWAHAIAPLARIVLLEMPSAMSTSIVDANKLAGKMGPGVISMSFGLSEAAWVTSSDISFTVPGMTYVAAAGDAGAQVLWPAVSPNVVAVGGTSLNWSGTGTRYEAAWGYTGGGMSAYEALPSWQGGVSAAGGSALTHRAVPDVAFDANPMTGEYVALTLPGAATAWLGYGGTSIAAPQWAGIVAVANAIRVANGKPLLGDIHSLLYKSIAAVPGNYAAALGDVVDGTNGTCATCRAGAGYDQATGLGTPSAGGLLPLLTGVGTVVTTMPVTPAPTPAPPAPVAVAPVVPGGAFSATAAIAFSQSLGVTAPSGTTTTYALAGAPAGVSVDATGTLKWSAPVAGSYAFTALANTAAGKSASAAYTLKVAAGASPTLSTSALTGSTGVVLAAALASTNPNNGTLSYSVTGAPAGLSASSNGAITWSAPVAGSYTLTAKVTDNFGYSSSKAVTLTIGSSNHAPTVAAATLAERAGVTFLARVSGADADGDGLTYTATGLPAGAQILNSGLLLWSAPVKGTYWITVTAHDTHGATGSGVVTLIVS